MVKTVGIYDHDKQWEVFQSLAYQNIKYAVLYRMAIETGLRISDLLALKQPEYGRKFEIRESKTGKIKEFEISQDMELMLYAYRHVMPPKSDDAPLFPVSRSSFWRAMKKAEVECGLSGVGVHGLRKTYG